MTITETPQQQLDLLQAVELEAARQEVVDFSTVAYDQDEFAQRQQDLEGRIEALVSLIGQAPVLSIELQPNITSHSNAYTSICRDFGRSAFKGGGVNVVDIPQGAINSKPHGLPMPGGNTKNGLRGGLFRPTIDMQIKTSHDPKIHVFDTSGGGVRLVEQEMTGYWYRLPLAYIRFLDESRDD